MTTSQQKVINLQLYYKILYVYSSSFNLSSSFHVTNQSVMAVKLERKKYKWLS